MASRPQATTRPAPAGGRSSLMLPLRIWDIPTRLFHWVLVLLVATCWASVEFNYMRVHMLSGQAILALLIFRIVWGMIGSDTARFAQFLRSPFAAIRHLMHFTKREPDTQVGHNEAGGWMVVVMLLVLLAQVTSGLLANNEDSFVEGPLSHLVGSAGGAQALMVHNLMFDVILVIVVAHVLAIIGYAVFKRHDLVRPMITGKKRMPAATPAPRMVSPILAAVILAVASGLVWLAVNKL